MQLQRVKPQLRQPAGEVLQQPQPAKIQLKFIALLPGYNLKCMLTARGLVHGPCTPVVCLRSCASSGGHCLSWAVFMPAMLRG